MKEGTILLNILKGFNVPPVVVGLVRGALEAAVLAGLGFLGANTEAIQDIVPAGVEVLLSNYGITEAIMVFWVGWSIRTLESVADQHIDPTQNTDADIRAALAKKPLGE